MDVANKLECDIYLICLFVDLKNKILSEVMILVQGSPKVAIYSQLRIAKKKAPVIRFEMNLS